MSELFLGVDVGTGSARAGLFTIDGKQVGRAEQTIQLWRERADHAEQSSDDIWSSVCTAVKGAMADANATPTDVVGIGFDATCSLVAIDAAGNPVSVSLDGGDERNIVVWMDHRAVSDAEEINTTHQPVLQFVGGKVSPEMQTPKLRWLKREHPECWQRTRYWFDLPDFLTWRATDCHDRSLCTTVCKWTYLGHERRWDPEYFKAIGLNDIAKDFSKIGERVRVPGECIGGLTANAAQELRLAAGTPVASSLIDAHAGALGLLGAAPAETALTRRLAIIAGTSACHLAVTNDKVFVPGVWGPYFEALTENDWLLEAGISASGAFLERLLMSHPAGKLRSNVFAAAEDALTKRLDRGETVASITDDLHLQPNVLGNRAPLADPTMKGGISGLTLNTQVDDLAALYLAALQSLAYASRHIIGAMREHNCEIDVIVASGSSANNPRWCQCHADATGIPVVVPGDIDGVLAGSAMLAARAAGKFPTLRAAMAAMARPGRAFYPDPSMKDFHDRKYAVYLRMIEDLRHYRNIMSG